MLLCFQFFSIPCVNGHLRSLNIDTQRRASKNNSPETIYPLMAFERFRPEQDILLGVTKQCSMRSAFFWFAEFCHSRRLSHFAASFIVTRAEASIAKSCEVKLLKSKYTSTILETLWNGLTTDAALNPLKNRESERRPRGKYFIPHRKIQVLDYRSWWWSFRRFIYGNLVTTSPSSKW